MSLNYLSANRSNLQFSNLETFNRSIINFNMPDITLGVIEQPSPFSSPKVSDTKILYGELNVEFIVMEDMSNYFDIFDWILSCSTSQTYSDYDTEGLYRDAAMIVHSSSNNPIAQIKFIGTLPTSLSSIEMTEESVETEVKKATATFAYQYYEVVRS
jgi:hypothetical protein